MARAEVLAYGPDLPMRGSYGGTDFFDGLRYSIGEDWVVSGQDEAPYIAKMVRSTSTRLLMLSNNPQRDLFGQYTTDATQAMLERGAKLELITSEYALGSLRETLGTQYSEEQVRVYSCGEHRRIAHEFTVADGNNTFMRGDDYFGLAEYPGARLVWGNKRLARNGEILFRQALHTLGIIGDAQLEQWLQENPPIPTPLERIKQALFHR